MKRGFALLEVMLALAILRWLPRRCYRLPAVR